MFYDFNSLVQLVYNIPQTFVEVVQHVSPSLLSCIPGLTYLAYFRTLVKLYQYFRNFKLQLSVRNRYMGTINTDIVLDADQYWQM